MNKEWIEKVDMLYTMKKVIREMERDMAAIEMQIRHICDNKSTSAGGYSYRCMDRKGTVDYSIIPELRDVNLDIYRKPSSKYWTLSKKDEVLEQ